MFFQFKVMQFLKKKSTLIINDQQGSYVISFVFIFLIVFMLIILSLQIGIIVSQQTEIQTATDAASLAGVSTIQVNPVSENVEVVTDNQGDVSEVNISIDDWEINADENIANDEAKFVYLLNTGKDLSGDNEFKGTLNPKGIAYSKDVDKDNLFYEYNVKIKDIGNPLIIWNSFLGNAQETTYSMESTSKTRIIIP